jgi:hypothetical protein
MSAYTYFGNCAEWLRKDVPHLTEMVDSATDITRKTFLAHVDRDDLRQVELGLGYDAHPKQGLTMAGDYHVSYHRSKYKGKRCYFFKWSGIEYVFTGAKL